MKLDIIALIPARSGSKRVKNKNIRPLNNHPMIAYSIQAALQSGIFTRVIVSTDSDEIAQIAKYYGAEVPFLRPEEFATDTSPDIEWIKHLLEKICIEDITHNCFSILRPTSPFRLPETIKRAWQQFSQDPGADSLRAVEKCSQHPAKMWRIFGNRMKPVMANPNYDETPWHSTPYQALPEIFVQNASLEIAYIDTVLKKGSIAGDLIMPFITDEFEGFDINHLNDWIIAEYLVANKLAKLPKINFPPHQSGMNC